MAELLLDLNGQWEFKQVDNNEQDSALPACDQWMPATVPGSVFSDLIKAGKIDESDFYPNPENHQWVSHSTWRFRKSFTYDKQPAFSERVELVCDGLDTAASIFLNGKPVGNAGNMFIGHRFDITSFLQNGENCLEIEFMSSFEFSEKMRQNRFDFMNFPFFFPHRVYVRKSQCQFGWDWAPPMAGCGIWQGIRLETVKTARLSQWHFQTLDCDADSAHLRITAEIDSVQDIPCECKITLSHATQKHTLSFTIPAGHTENSTEITLSDPALWWPIAYGPQNLYDLTIDLYTDDTLIDSLKKQVGIRCIQLKQKPDEYGPDFQFVVNGQPVFARGANWIPPNLLFGTADQDRYKTLVTAAKDCNLNILRVWGGGCYEPEWFYELCDQMGIMVWQDFMFACSYYPDDQAFLDIIKEEATVTVKRLRNHPSLILWCGNNEIEWMHNEGWIGGDGTFHGESIWHELLPEITEKLDSTTPYIPSSPVLAEGEGKGRDHISAHSWHVWSLHEAIRGYLYQFKKVPPRFVAEFGMQSLPNSQALKQITTENMSHISDYSLEKHNYQIDGNARLHAYNNEYFTPPQNLEDMRYQTQVTQARGIKQHVEHLRVNHTISHGAIYWQWHDCWPGITWSAVDVNAQPKALWYYTRRFYAPRLVTLAQTVSARFEKTPFPTPEGIVVVNDLPEEASGIIHCRLLNLNSDILDEFEKTITIERHSTSKPIALPDSMLKPKDQRSCALHVCFSSETQEKLETLFFYMPDKYLLWPEAEIDCRLEKIDSRQWKATLQSHSVIRDVCLLVDTPAVFSDNYFDLTGLGQREIIIQTQTDEPKLTLTIRAENYRKTVSQ